MTTDKDFKKLVRAHSAKTGKSYRAALDDFTRLPAEPGALPAQPAEDGAASAFAQLMADPFTVIAGRMPARAGSAVLAIAQARARELARHAQYFAENGIVQTLVSLEQLQTLLRAGAADGGNVQMLRSFHNDHGTTFSKSCRKCRRWIWCGETGREDKCVCGQVYRVTFDLWRGYHWTLRQGPLCMDCGTAKQLTTPAEGRNPWRTLSAWQSQCQACARIAGNSGEGTTRPAEERQLPRDVMVRHKGGFADAHYVSVRFHPDKGETLEDAFVEARRESWTRPDLLQVQIRRMDQPGHPFVCSWKRKTSDSPWEFTWLEGADAPTAESVSLW